MIEKGLIGSEDVDWGISTSQRRARDGSFISITQVNAGDIPIIDSADRFAGETVEAALAEVVVATGAGSNAADYYNNSGGARTAGEVVVVSTGADEAFTTTTSSGATNVLGVVAEAIAAGEVGSVVTGGFVETVEVDAATSRGSFLITSTTAGKASPVSSSQSGVFGIALSSTAGAGQVSALLFGVLAQDYLPLSGGNLTGTVGFFKGTDVSSATALDPFASSNTGNYFDVTGTTTITSISTSGNVGTIIWLHFDDAVTVTHHATNLILPGSANITTSTGDELAFVEYASGQWRMVGYIDASTTGTGNMVRATSPTLTTPVINNPDLNTDTIDEFTATAGVTIDGVLLKDSLIQTEAVTQASILWSSAGGISQEVINSFEYTQAGAGFTEKFTVPIYVPSNATTLEYAAQIHGDSGGGAGTTSDVRLKCASATGSTLSTLSTTYVTVSGGTLTISAESGWTDITMEMQTSVTDGETASVRHITGRFI